MTPINMQEVPLEDETDSFVDLQCYLTDNTDVKVLLVTMNSLIKEQSQVRWSVRELGIACWGGLTRACNTRAMSCEPQCWRAASDALGGRELSAREASRAADALALLVLPPAPHAAVSLLCALCQQCPVSSEWLTALTPALQLAAHHARRHPDLLSALRKLEEGVQTPPLSHYKPSIEALVHNVAGPAADASREAREPREAPRPPTNLQAAQEVGRRVSLMFQQSKHNMNIPNIFKKKT
ncbi:hypothetical protein ACJJTC_003673 [Scirpophaga incertulas]